MQTKLEAFVSRAGVDVTSKILAQEGPVWCCKAPSSGFSYKGQNTFDVKAGDVYGFRISGANQDLNRILRGTLKLAEVDATAPVVTHAVTGSKDAGDFYSGRVDVKFTVVENESRISAQTGCDATTVTDDTAGKTITCTVTSRGGTTTDSVTIKHDETAPSLSLPSAVVKQADGADGATVIYDAAATDAGDPTPVVACTPASGTRFALGTTTVTCTATDAAGHSASRSFDAIVFPAPAVTAPAVHGSPSGGAAPAGLKPINAVLAFRFTIAKQTTRLVQLKIKNLPKGATVSVTCKGASCPKKLKGAGSTLKSKGSTLSLTTLVNANLKGGTTINIAISASGATTTIKSLAVRKGKAPVVNTCTASGTKPVAC